jgi:hypothetical protein
VEEWRIVMALRDDDDPDSLLDHLAVFAPRERHSIVTWGVPEEDLFGATDRQLLIDVAAETEERASEIAGELYTKARERAGLETKVLIFLGYARLNAIEPLHDRLLARAGIRLGDGHYEEAVRLDQTACEIRAKEVLVMMLNRAGMEAVVPALPRSVAFRDDLTRRLFLALSGRRITDEPWWSDYKAHCLRRHGVVHQGLSVDEAGARASHVAAQAFISYLADSTAD